MRSKCAAPTSACAICCRVLEGEWRARASAAVLAAYVRRTASDRCSDSCNAGMNTVFRYCASVWNDPSDTVNGG